MYESGVGSDDRTQGKGCDGAAELNTSQHLEFKLNTALDIDLLRKEFLAKRRVLIPNFLEEPCAVALYQDLAKNVPWSMVLGLNRTVKEANSEILNEIGIEERCRLVEEVYMATARGFSFVYENDGSVPETSTTRLPSTLVLRSYSNFARSEKFLELMRHISGKAPLNSADAHATCYRSGYFRMFNEKGDELSGRKVATSLCLTPEWDYIWGGLLQFRGFTGHVEEVHTPRFNAMSVFDVCQSHAISFVSPFARTSRYCVDAWVNSIDSRIERRGDVK